MNLKKLWPFLLISMTPVVAWGLTEITGGRLKILEIDGSPAGFIHTLKVTNGSLAVSAGVGTLTIGAGGGGGGGSLRFYTPNNNFVNTPSSVNVDTTNLLLYTGSTDTGTLSIPITASGTLAGLTVRGIITTTAPFNAPDIANLFVATANLRTLAIAGGGYTLFKGTGEAKIEAAGGFTAFIATFAETEPAFNAFIATFTGTSGEPAFSAFIGTGEPKIEAAGGFTAFKSTGQAQIAAAGGFTAFKTTGEAKIDAAGGFTLFKGTGEPKIDAAGGFTAFKTTGEAQIGAAGGFTLFKTTGQAKIEAAGGFALFVQTATANLNILQSQIYNIVSTNSAHFTQISNSTNSLFNSIFNLSTGSASGGGGGVKSLYLSTPTDSTNANTYFLAFTTPSTAVEITKTASVAAANGLVIVSSHSTLAGGLGQGVNLIPAGFWQFVMWAGVDAIVGQTDLVIDVATMSKTGTNLTRIISSTITNINTIAVNQYVGESLLTSDVSISTDDRVQVSIYAKTTSAIARTVSMTFQGSAHASRIGTTVEKNPTFLSLNDVPQTYFGQAGKYPQVNATESGLSFVTINANGAADSLGNHVATQPLNGGNFALFNFSSGTITGPVVVGSATIAGTLTSTSPAIFANVAFNSTNSIILQSFVGGASTAAVVGSSNVSVSLFQFDGQSSSGTNFCIGKVPIPWNYIAGSTVSFDWLQFISTGLTTQAGQYGISFSTGGASQDPQYNIYQSTIVISVTPTTTGTRGGESNYTTLTSIGGPVAWLAPKMTLYVKVTRFGKDAVDTDNALTILNAMEFLVQVR